MKFSHRETLKAIMGTEGRFKMTRYQVFEMHLFDENAAEERANCGRDTTRTERRGLKGYLEDRLREAPVGAVCQECKALAMPLAKNIIADMAQNLEDEGRWGEAEDWRQLADTLAKETGQDDSRG